MAITCGSSLKNNKKQVSFSSDHEHKSTTANILDSPLDDNNSSQEEHATNVLRDQYGSLPAAQGLYDPDNEKDSCVSLSHFYLSAAKSRLGGWALIVARRVRSFTLGSTTGSRIRLPHQGKAFAQDCLGCQSSTL